MLRLTRHLCLGTILLGCTSLLLWTVSTSTVGTFASEGKGGRGGPPLDVPLEFDATTFQHALRDSTRPFWFIQFYAPYCRHCIRMAPILGTVAKKLGATTTTTTTTTTHIMAIGQMDCTRFKPICNRYNVRAYPTFVYVRNGQVFPYEGGRDESSLLEFAQRMSQPAVTIVHDMEEAKKIAREHTTDGVAFVGMDRWTPKKDPSSSSLASSAGSSSSEPYKLFEKVAFQNQATAYFVWVQSRDGNGARTDFLSNPTVQRIEPGVVKPQTWEFGQNVDFSKPSDAAVLKRSLETWVLERTVPSLITLTDAETFLRTKRACQKTGRPLVLTIVDSLHHPQVVDARTEHMMAYIRSALPTLQPRDKYYYGLLDANRWAKYLDSFHVRLHDDENSSQFLMVDYTKNEFWHNVTYTSIDSFLMAVQDGTVEPQRYGSTKGAFLVHAQELFLEYYPFSVAVPVIVLCLLVMLFTKPPEFDPSNPVLHLGGKSGTSKVNEKKVAVGSEEESKKKQ